MAQLGVPVKNLFSGTLNVALEGNRVPWPEAFEFDFILDWRHPDPPTHFRLHPLRLQYQGQHYAGWSYRKLYPLGYVSQHPQPENVIEILAPRLEGIGYGDHLLVAFAV